MLLQIKPLVLNSTVRDDFWSTDKIPPLGCSPQTCLMRGGNTEEVGAMKVCLMVTVSIAPKNAEMQRDLASEMVLLFHFSFCSRRASQLQSTELTLASLAEQELNKGCMYPAATLPTREQDATTKTGPTSASQRLLLPVSRKAVIPPPFTVSPGSL